MKRFNWWPVCAGAASAVLAYAAFGAALAAPAGTPDFSSNGSGWQTGNGGEFGPVPGSPGPMRQDPAHPFVGNGQGKQPTYRIGDLTNPNLKQWAKDVMKKDNDEVLAGKIAYTPASSCKPAGVPAIDLQGGPFYFVQTPKEVVILLEQDHQVRRVYLDAPHSQNPKASWYGESIGHYEGGDTLVVDTIGLSTQSFVDNYRTPHTDKLHVIERFKLVDEGKNMQISMTVEDPGTFNQPWQATRNYRRMQGTLQEEACAENNQHLFDYHIPVADNSTFEPIFTEDSMSGYVSSARLLAGGAIIGFAATALAVAQPSEGVPDLQSGQTAWLHPPGGEFPAVAGSPVPMRQDPAHPFVGNNTGRQPTYRLGDVSNANLKQWAKDVMKKDNEEVLKGKIAFSARSSCLPGGTPVFTLFGGQPIFFIQTRDKVLMIYEGDHQVRHVYLNVPHSANAKPSWYGESVGHYEGDTLVVDTIGQNTKTVVDSYRTPHTEKLHVVERYKLNDGGKKLHVDIRVEDSDTFNQPWSSYQDYNRGVQTLEEEACAENNQHLFDYHIPTAERPDF